MGLIGACAGAFSAFAQFFDCLPVAIRICIYAAAGLFLLVGVLRLLIH